MKEKKDFRLIFMGTPEFAVESLKILIENNFNIIAVVTSPDKPAGRGQLLSQSAVKVYALENNIPVLQPTRLKDDLFFEQLSAYNPDLMVIVAFRMLPEKIWNLPPLGSINLHASLLPQYRGAAPINWAIIHGEKVTGITTFFLKHEIDTGNILFQKEVPIEPGDNAGTLHDKLMVQGAVLLNQTIELVRMGEFKEIPQANISISQLRHAPKIFKEDGKINWQNPVEFIHNLIRGLSPYPTAWAYLESPKDQSLMFKVFQSGIERVEHRFDTGTLLTDEKSYLKVAVKDGFIVLEEIQISGKKRMKVSEFLNGFKGITKFKAV